jgi:hypothetical protein
VRTGCGWGSQREKGHWGDPDVDGDNIKMDIQEFGVGRGDCMDSAQDRVRWRTFVSTVKNFRV